MRDNKTYVIRMPVVGSPYLVSNEGNKKEDIQRAVEGNIEEISKIRYVSINRQANKRWQMVDWILHNKEGRFTTREKPQIYKNDMNLDKPINPNCFVKDELSCRGNKMIYGPAAIVGKSYLLSPSYCNFPECMTLVHSEKTEDGFWKFDTEEEKEAFKKECDEKGWDFDEKTGQCYMAKVKGPCEQFRYPTENGTKQNLD